MEKEEIICISSDEEEVEKNTKKTPVSTSIKTNNVKSVKPKDELMSDDDGQKETNRPKRKAVEMVQDTVIHNNSPSEKRMKRSISQDSNKSLTSTDKKSCNKVVNNTTQQKSRQNNSTNQKNNVVNAENQPNYVKPQLVVKEKRVICQTEQDVFPMFISLCLQKDRSEDMKKIVNKLKRRYEQLDPNYTGSEHFSNLLNEKRNAIMDSNRTLYIHIEEVMREMKSKRKKQSIPIDKDKVKNQNVSTTASTSDVPIKETKTESENKVSNNDDNKEDPKSIKTDKRIRIIVKKMAKCEKLIKKLEEAEVDFKDENDSSYIQLERYKQRMVELYNLYCKLSGESRDAGRPYLRPKHFNVTDISAVNQAITNLINVNLYKKRNLDKPGSFAQALIFPDYADILHCVGTCNSSHNLGLNKQKQQQIARKAFSKLGEKLQRIRREDFWETFSLFLEDKDDPASKDPTLAEKLRSNRVENEKKLSEVFETYVKRQEEMKDQTIDEKTPSEDEDQENNSQTEEEDKNSEIGEKGEEEEEVEEEIEEEEEEEEEEEDGDDDDDDDDDDDNDEDISILEDRIVVQKNKNNEVEKSTTVKDISTINGDKVDVGQARNNKDIIVIDENTNLDNKTVTKTTKDAVNVSVNSVNDIKKGNESSTPVSSSVTCTDTTNRTEEDDASILSEVSNSDQQHEEDKPLLRVRSFAKPPNTWEDDKQKVDKSSTQDTSKETTKTNLTIKSTDDSSPVVNKRATVRVAPNIISMAKGKYKVIIPSKNVVNIQNITKNYVKLNYKDTDKNTIVNLKSGQLLKPIRPVGLNQRGSTIILPKSNQQTQNTNETPIKTSQTKRNGTVLQIISHHKERVVLPKEVIQNLPKIQLTDLTATKSK